jgi:AcrR family transcriptional regulator
MTAPARSGALAADQKVSADQKILDLACDHLRRFGPRRTTIVGIAEAAGMSHANVYRYFPSKEALFETVTSLWLKPLEEELAIIVQGQDPAYDKLERALTALQHAYRDKRDNDPILFRLLCDAIEQGGGIARKHRNKVQTAIQAIVEEGIGSGAFRMQDRRRAMALIFDLAHRFIQPVSIALDKAVSTGEMEFRAGRVIGVIQRSMTYGDPDFDM